MTSWISSTSEMDSYGSHTRSSNSAKIVRARKKPLDQPLSAEESLEMAEGLFVACRFTEAARVSSEYLASIVGCGRDESATIVPVVNFGDDFIAPLGECDVADLIVAVLLQCGYELRRKEDWDLCRSFYSKRGPMPFEVAILWLRLRLAGGEIDLVRQVLWQLRVALGDELRSVATSSDSISVEERVRRSDKARTNYVVTMEMLIVETMLPFGESPEASSLVSGDPYLNKEEEIHILTACGLSAGEDGVKSGTEGALDGNPTTCQHEHDGTAGSAACPLGNGHLTSRTSQQPPGVDGEGQSRPVPNSNYFNGMFSDWTLETRLQVVVGISAAGLGALAAFRNRQSLWRATRSATVLVKRTAVDLGNFIVGSS